MATIAQTTKLRVIRKSVAQLYRLEVVTFTDDTYLSLSDDTIIMSSSDEKEKVCIKRKSTNCSTRKAFLEKAVVELVYKFDKKSYRKCLKGESIAKIRLQYLVHKHIPYLPEYKSHLSISRTLYFSEEKFDFKILMEYKSHCSW